MECWQDGYGSVPASAAMMLANCISLAWVGAPRWKITGGRVGGNRWKMNGHVVGNQHNCTSQ